jgi:hypothetical protein
MERGYASNMGGGTSKAAGLILTLLIAGAGFASAQSFAVRQDSAPALGAKLDGSLSGAVQPAYRFIEGLSDGAYNFVRVHLICSLLPERMTRSLKAAPSQDSGELFAKNLHDRQARLLERERADYPFLMRQGAASDPRRLQEWRARFVEDQEGVVLDAFADTLFERYQLKSFGRASEGYVKDARNWDAGSAAMTGVIGGALLYVRGFHATVPAGPLTLKIDLRPGQRLAQALTSGGEASGLGSFELGYRDAPVTLAMEWGVAGGRVRGDSAGLKYRLRY